MVEGNGTFHLKRIMMIVVSLMAVLSLLGCAGDEVGGIDSEKAEAIALEKFEKDVKDHNETSWEKSVWMT
jgi:hypothetical protein